MGHYRVHMGFRRRKERVMRAAAATTTKRRRRSIPGLTSPATPITPTTAPQQPVPTVPDPDGPRIFFDTLLDSGATLPCLFESDMSKLRISRTTYAAQSSRMIATADSMVHLRVYELDVGVYASPPSPDDRPAAAAATTTGTTAEDEEEEEEEPDAERELRSCTLPVVAFPGGPHSPNGSNGSGNSFTAATAAAGGGGTAHPDAAPDRLSGLLPFHACYMSSAPGNFKLWLGSERRDVLGAGRLPGQMRFGEVKGAAAGEDARRKAATGRRAAKTRREEEEEQWWLEQQPRLGTPKRVIFEHDLADGTGRVLRDEEGEGGSVIMMCGPGGTESDQAGSRDPESAGIEVLRVERKSWASQQRRRMPPKKYARQTPKSEPTEEKV
jgi:hypothetical protein